MNTFLNCKYIILKKEKNPQINQQVLGVITVNAKTLKTQSIPIIFFLLMFYLERTMTIMSQRIFSSLTSLRQALSCL